MIPTECCQVSRKGAKGEKKYVNGLASLREKTR